MTALALEERKIVLALQVEPELRAVAEIAAEPERGIGVQREAALARIGEVRWKASAGLEVRLRRSQLALTALYDEHQ
jgi:hypothetical protein